MKKAVECFDKNLNNIEHLNKSFFKENDLELRKSYILEFNNRFVRLTIIDKTVSEKLGIELNDCFRKCFKELTKKK